MIKPESGMTDFVGAIYLEILFKKNHIWDKKYLADVHKNNELIN